MDDLQLVDDDIIGLIDWSNIVDDNLSLPGFADGPVSDPSPDSNFVEIENLLMEDNDDPVAQAPSDSSAKEYCDKFLADLFVGEVEEDSSPSVKDVGDAGLDKGKTDATADDHMSKKRTRKMRNRDAAERSRERKKMYVKNLEMKSRYLEGECRKLGHLLQCCYAENHALRLCLQSSSAFGASMNKQESAVLFLGEAYEPYFLYIVVVLCRAM